MSNFMEKIAERVVPKYLWTIPEVVAIKQDINYLNMDLFHGPLYFADGEVVTMWDEGAKPFDFPGTLSRVSDVLSKHVGDLWIDTQSEDWTTDWPDFNDEFCGDWLHLEYKDVLRYAFGKELANML